MEKFLILLLFDVCVYERWRFAIWKLSESCFCSHVGLVYDVFVVDRGEQTIDCVGKPSEI